MNILNYQIKELIRRESLKLINRKNMDKCSECKSKKDINIHHEIYRWKPKTEDLQILCKPCHRKKHKKREIKTILIEEQIPIYINKIKYRPLIKVKLSTYKLLDRLKIHKGQSFDEVIIKLIRRDKK